MASTYYRTDSPFIWIRYKDKAGKWKSANTGYRRDNPGDRRQAGLLAKEKSLEEMRDKPARNADQNWEDWVMPWISSRWGARANGTIKKYTNYFWSWLKYFKESDIPQPAALRREHVISYLAWREKRGGARNTAILEIRWLAMLLDEAIARGYIRQNPARKLTLETTPRDEKIAWSEDEVERVDVALSSQDEFGWMRVTFLMGLYQAARLRQAQIPLSCIDFNRRIISYPASYVKGGKAYSQPIDPAFYPILQELVAHRRSLGKSMLCELPVIPSVYWRRFLDELGLQHLVHHGLRATWCTRAALAGIPESLAKRFANHSSSIVHSVYQKITASDLMPMLDALALYRRPSALPQPVIETRP